MTINEDGFYEGDEHFFLETEVPVDEAEGTFRTEALSFRITIKDNDPRPSIAEIGDGKHAVARAEALVDNQPRLIPMLRNLGAQASEFALHASGEGVNVASGEYQAEAIWGAASFSRTSDEFGEHEYLLATMGAHFRMSERLHLGGMLQFDRSGSEPDGAGDSGEIAGAGWMVGPYFALREGSQPLYFEGRLLFGRSSNDSENLVIASNPAVNASFGSERWLAHGRVEGTFQVGNGMTLIPLADFSHVRDEMETFRDGNRIGDGGTVVVTKLQLGTEFEIPVETAKDLKLKPGLRLVVSDVDNVATELNAGRLLNVNRGKAAEYRVRIDFGVDYRLDDDLVLGFESFYSGRDMEEFESYGAGLNLKYEF